MIITIDGSAGSGKSTVARKLAARLEIAYLDTGAMYRALAYIALQRGMDFADRKALLEMAKSVRLDVDCGPTHTRIRVDTHDVSEAIRTMAVSTVTPYVARHAEIRSLLVAQQQEIGRQLGSCVSEGRDQGTVVFPDAAVKFILDATIAKRAERRHEQLVADGDTATLEEVLENLQARDRIDTKQWEPLVGSGGAFLVDTTGLTIPQVIDRMFAAVALVRE